MTEHTKNDCPQEDRLERIEEDMHNHRSWRNTTSTQLTNIEIMLATINERLKQFDKNMEVSRGFKTAIISVCSVMFLSIVTAVYAYGRAVNQIDVNTKRLETVETRQGILIGNVK